MKLQVKYVPTTELVPYARNAKTHPPEQVAQIAGSLKEFGFINPVIVDKDMSIVAGHGRVLAAQKLGLTEVPTVSVEHLTPTQVKAFRLADNRIHQNGFWDMEMLKIEVEELDNLDFDVKDLGFNEADVAALLGGELASQDPNAEWDGMPEYESKEPCFRKVVVNFGSAEDVDNFFQLIDQKYTDKTKSIWFPFREPIDHEGTDDDGE